MTAIFATHTDPTIAARNLQQHLNSVEKWLRKWKMKVNESTSTPNVYPPGRTLPSSQYQPNHHTPNRISKIPTTTLRLKAKPERTYYQEQKTNRLKRGKLSNREEIPSIYRKQINSMQRDNQTNMALRNRTVGLYQQSPT